MLDAWRMTVVPFIVWIFYEKESVGNRSWALEKRETPVDSRIDGPFDSYCVYSWFVFPPLNVKQKLIWLCSLKQLRAVSKISVANWDNDTQWVKYFKQMIVIDYPLSGWVASVVDI